MPRLIMLIIAFNITSNLRIHATKATFLGLPDATSF